MFRMPVPNMVMVDWLKRAAHTTAALTETIAYTTLRLLQGLQHHAGNTGTMRTYHDRPI